MKRVFRGAQIRCKLTRQYELTDKEIAQTLAISFRTVHHHNQHAYDKIGVSTRAAAALFLIENDLLDG